MKAAAIQGATRTQVASGRRGRVLLVMAAEGGFWAVPAVHGHSTLTGNDRSPRHLNWSEPWASAVPLVSGAGDQ